MTREELESLSACGWFQREGFRNAAAIAKVVAARAAAGLFTPAGISRSHQLDSAVRSDALLWVNPDDAELASLVATFEALRLELNEGAWLGLTSFELQLARYDCGGHYQRHRDALRGESNRRVTAIAYLNPDWEPSHQGQLRLFLHPVVEVEPKLGRLVVFLSEVVEHEVVPSRAVRFAATAWYSAR